MFHYLQKITIALLLPFIGLNRCVSLTTKGTGYSYKNIETSPILTSWTNTDKSIISSPNLINEKHKTLNADRNDNNATRLTCPPDFSSEIIDDRPYCYIETKPQKYPPRCPYKTYLPYDFSPKTKEYFKKKTFWMRTTRDLTNGYGPFESATPYVNYGEIIRNYEIDGDGEKISEKNCLVYNAGTIKAVSCNKQYPGLCLYTYYKDGINKYCNSHNPNQQCISDSLSIDKHKCYCEKHARKGRWSRNQFCQKLAEPLTLFQTNLILTQLTTEETVCWFSLYQENAQLFWSSSNKEVEYVSWAKDAEIDKPFGALAFQPYMGWTTEKDGLLDCAICEIQNSYDKTPNLTLEFESKNRIFLHITNPHEINEFYGTIYSVHCFSDHKEMKYKLRAEIYNIPHDTNYFKKRIEHIQSNFNSYYWCEAFHHPNMTLTRSNTLLVPSFNEDTYGREYVVHITAPVTKGLDPYIDNADIKACKQIRDITQAATMVVEVKPVKIFKFDETKSQIDILLYIATRKSHFPIAEETKIIQEQMKLLKDMHVRVFTTSEFCLADKTSSDGMSLTWPETSIGGNAIPNELCVQSDFSPVTRKCEGNSVIGGIWGPIIGNCVDPPIYPERLLSLHALLNNETVPPSRLTTRLSEITSKSAKVIPIEAHFATEIFRRIAICDYEIKLSDASTIVNNIMSYDSSVLKEAQKLLNSTDNLLYYLDRMLAKVKLERFNNYACVSTPELLVQVSDILKTNVTGMAVKASKRGNGKQNIVPIFRNTTIESLLYDKDIEAATFIPAELLQEILRTNKSRKLVISQFNSAALFNENVKEVRESNSRILSIFIPGFKFTSNFTLPLIFKPLHNYTNNVSCSYWKYGKNRTVNLQGRWAIQNVEERVEASIHKICEFNHTTHFALLILGNPDKVKYYIEHTTALNWITGIGCGLSILGVLAIFSTALVFKSWRVQPGNIIMINFSVAIASQMALLFIADNVKPSTVGCVLAGAALHYTLISEFCWMLVISILQYRKFVSVFQNQIQHVVAKACAACWGLPLLPVMVLLAISPDNYNTNSFGLCYPTEIVFYFAVFLPIFLIVAINLFIFVKILLNICCRSVKAYGSTEQDIQLEVLLAIMLFFLLGLSWIFGILASVEDGVLFGYLFTLTATLQGFAIFIFFILMNEKVRLLWINNVKKMCHSYDQDRRLSRSTRTESFSSLSIIRTKENRC